MRVYRKHIDRITIIGPNNDDDGDRAFAYCAENSYHIIRCGPKPAGAYRYDSSKYKIVAEREWREAHEVE